jgi:acetyl-CoA acetyltransferase
VTFIVEAVRTPVGRQAFRPDGTVTAGNASQLNDGAAALLLASERATAAAGLTPLARIAARGAIAVGHPLGCSGARILGTLARELRRRGGGWRLAAICIGVGQGLAVVLEG